MAYLLGKYIFLLLRPSNLLLLMGLLGLGGLALRRPWGVRLLAAAWLGLALATFLPLGAWLSLPLEERFPPPPTDAPCPGGVDGAVVLGGGVSAAVTRARGQPSFRDNMERVAAIPELARRFPDATILYTGGVGWTDEPGALSEAAVVARFLARQGLPADRVMLEHEARSTRENALRSLPLARPEPGSCWLLVTSAMHMPRSIGVFRKAGWPEMTPMPVDYHTTGEVALDGLPIVSDRLSQLDQAAYEWYGLIYYWLLGYTDAPFPGPTG
jgi:uncharacterized SAM-binding protein YcdF (DUF218 family)